VTIVYMLLFVMVQSMYTDAE